MKLSVGKSLLEFLLEVLTSTHTNTPNIKIKINKHSIFFGSGRISNHVLRFTADFFFIYD